MILIADSGSTKTDWCCVDTEGWRISFRSEGYNPNYITRQYMIDDIIKNIPDALDTSAVSRIYFYGAGVTEMQFGFIEKALRAVFTSAREVFVAMDLLASARALLGDSGGFAAILGTGTNSCLYDGRDVTLNIDSLGFILGDEGSGGYIGKRLICDFIRGDMPENVHKTVAEELRLSGDELIDQIYTKPFPNRFCARYCSFVGQNLHTDIYFYNLVLESFRALFRNIISHYPHYADYELNCVGSVGYAFSDILQTVAGEYGMKMGKLLKYPMDGLVEYHIKH